MQSVFSGRKRQMTAKQGNCVKNITNYVLLRVGLTNGDRDSEELDDSEEGGVAFINIQSESERLSSDTEGKCRPIVPEELVCNVIVKILVSLIPQPNWLLAAFARYEQTNES